MAVNDDLFEAVVRHAHYVERWKTHEVNQMVGFLNDEVFPRTTELIQNRLNSLSPVDARKAAQLQRLNLALRKQFRTDYGPSRNEVRKNVLDFAEYEAEWIRGTIQNAAPIGVDLASPSTEALRAILSPNAIEGDVLGKSWQKWWRAFENNTNTRIMQQVRLGVAEGRTTPEIVRSLVGTRTNNYTDGIYQASRREASMIVRTATNDASARAREMTYKQNDDVISGVKYVATLDGRTTIRCASLDGRIFRVGDGPRPPQHPNCRSTTVPVTKSWKELGIPLKDTNATTRASMNGQVSAKMSYSEWLKKQPADIQNRVLGQSRAQLFRQGKVRLDRFQDNGKTLTLDELKRMDNLDQKRVFPGERVI